MTEDVIEEYLPDFPASAWSWKDWNFWQPRASVSEAMSDTQVLAYAEFFELPVSAFSDVSVSDYVKLFPFHNALEQTHWDTYWVAWQFLRSLRLLAGLNPRGSIFERKRLAGEIGEDLTDALLRMQLYISTDTGYEPVTDHQARIKSVFKISDKRPDCKTVSLATRLNRIANGDADPYGAVIGEDLQPSEASAHTAAELLEISPQAFTGLPVLTFRRLVLHVLCLDACLTELEAARQESTAALSVLAPDLFGRAQSIAILREQYGVDLARAIVRKLLKVSYDIITHEELEQGRRYAKLETCPV